MEVHVIRFKSPDKDGESLTDLKTNKQVAAFKWTGTLVNGKRFQRVSVGTAEALRFMSQINVYRGNLWVVYYDGTKTLLKRVYN